ncbi:hypothetical protein BJY04DRAFT_184442 [Aspergillus karnatakaensis]|uniref:uncharacterized protein n=1 Tax=Aspergillus karnatakaensis TaxID=1810916 RepID=UPI003CCDF081
MLSLLLLAPLLAGQSIATATAAAAAGASSHPPLKRHHDNENANAFTPATADGCPNNWPICGSSGVCYNPDEGQTCCPGGKYACPASSFCLLAPYCCPDILTPEQCAEKFGLAITQTTSFVDGSGLLPTSHPPPPLSLGGDDDDDEDEEDEEEETSTSSGASVTISSTPLPTPESSLIPWPSMSASVSPSVTLTEVELEPTFTGGAVMELGGGEVVWGVVGAVAVALGV